MQTHSAFRFFTLIIAFLVPLVVLVNDSNAGGRRTVSEFNGLSPTTGDEWSTSSAACSDPASTAAATCSIAVGDNGSSDAIALGFTVRIGSTDYNTIFIHENGVVTFGSKWETSSFVDAADIAALTTAVGRPFIAPYYVNFIVPNQTSNLFDTSEDMIGYFRAQADPTEPYHPVAFSDPPDPIDERVPAMAITWRDLDLAVTQIVIYKNGTAGDFDIRFRYGRPNGFNDIYSTGLGGFSLATSVASDTVNIPAPFGGGDLVSSGGDLFFSVRGGHVVGTAPPNPDTDGDGVLDTTDNCKTVANPDQADADTDGIGNACDSDTDGDGVANTTDNCPVVYNPNQADGNANGIGDACDAPPPPPTGGRCYVDSDRDVDALDILQIVLAISKKAKSPTDPRDADGSGTITLKDAAQCTQVCTRKYCAIR